MSEENVELVQRVFDAVARRDVSGILELYDPEIEIRSGPETLAEHIGQRRVYRGHDGLRAIDRELRQAFDKLETTCEELIDAGERVVSASRYRARGRESGVELEGPVQFGVWTIREAKITEVVWFSTRGEALEAAGLSDAGRARR